MEHTDKKDSGGTWHSPQEHADRGAGHGHEHLVTVQVDQIQVTSPQQTTAGDLLVAAGLDPTARQLVEVNGRHQTSYESTANLQLHRGQVFITVSTGPTPVS